MSDEPPKVTSMVMRRTKQLNAEAGTKKDRIMQLADELTTLLGQQQLEGVIAAKGAGALADEAFSFACDQLVALALSRDALMKVLEHSLGVEMMNSVIVESEHRSRQYTINSWPKHDNTATYVDQLKDEEPEPEEVAEMGRIFRTVECFDGSGEDVEGTTTFGDPDTDEFPEG